MGLDYNVAKWFLLLSSPLPLVNFVTDVSLFTSHHRHRLLRMKSLQHLNACRSITRRLLFLIPDQIWNLRRGISSFLIPNLKRGGTRNDLLVPIEFKRGKTFPRPRSNQELGTHCNDRKHKHLVATTMTN